MIASPVQALAARLVHLLSNATLVNFLGLLELDYFATAQTAGMTMASVHSAKVRHNNPKNNIYFVGGKIKFNFKNNFLF